jgi:MoxR-like ATPase
VKNTTDDQEPVLNTMFTAEEILEIQHLVRRIPVPDNVVRYAVELAQKTRPGQKGSSELVNQYLDWGAGPRASQNLVLAAKAHAAVDGRFSPDIADVKAVAPGILRHRILRNYKAEAEGISDESIIEKLL